jgi:hypothetical protein
LAEEYSKEREYEEWLGRLDVPLEEEVDIETFQEYLTTELGIPYPSQHEALWGALEIQQNLGEHGIRGVNIEYPWGVERRYGVQGLPGLWGWDRIQEIRAAEGW